MTTTRAIAASIVGLAVAAGIGAAGYVAIANTTDGQVVGGGPPEVTFPATPTATVAVVDQNGNLTSVAALAVRPGDDDHRRGGTVVPVPVSADSSGGFGTERTPLNETVALFGPETLAEEVPALLGVGIDQLIVVDEGELAELLAPIGSVQVDLPAAVTDAAGRQVAPAGPQTLAPDQLAEILSTTDPKLTGADRYPIDVAVWGAIADVVGDGLATPLGAPASPSAGDSVADAAAPVDVLSAVTSGPIAVQPLRSAPIVSLDRNPRGVDAAALDRAEVLVILGHVAPSKVAAPNPGYNFRVVSPFSDEQLADAATRLDVAYTATEALLGIDANVISVDTSPGEAENVTVIEVSDENLVAAARSLADVFGPVEVRVADSRIAGVDVVATLGTDYLDRARHRRCFDRDLRGDNGLNEDVPADPESLRLAVTVSHRADEKQGRNIVVLDVRGVLAITDYFVVVDAPNRRLVRTLVDDVEAGVREATGRSPLRVEGEREQQWVLIDYGDVVVHVFLDEIRRFYEIERLYRDVPTIAWSQTEPRERT